jgi:hypothetical protein
VARRPDWPASPSGGGDGGAAAPARADVPVHVVDTQTFQREWQSRVPGDEGALPNAFYDTNTDEIVIRHDQFDAQTVIHEGTHAAYHRAIDDNPKAEGRHPRHDGRG